MNPNMELSLIEIRINNAELKMERAEILDLMHGLKPGATLDWVEQEQRAIEAELERLGF